MRKKINKIKDMPKTRNDENFDGKKGKCWKLFFILRRLSKNSAFLSCLNRGMSQLKKIK